jgi:hypothetical protein
VRKYILIPIILVCAFGCGKNELEDEIKGLESTNQDLGVKLLKQGTELESASGVIKDVNDLLKVIQETEIKIEGKELKLRNTIEMESTVDMRQEILDSIQGLYDELREYREKAVELQERLDFLSARKTQQNEIISSLTAALEEETTKVGDLSNSIGRLNKNVTHLKSELGIKEMEIKSLHREINSIFYVIGNSRELIRKKIIVKRGIPIIRSLNPFSRNYVLGEDFTLAEFTHERSLLNEFSVDGKIKKILPYRSGKHYDIAYENGLSFVSIKDSKNFWHQKYLVIVTW